MTHSSGSVLLSAVDASGLFGFPAADADFTGVVEDELDVVVAVAGVDCLPALPLFASSFFNLFKITTMNFFSSTL